MNTTIQIEINGHRHDVHHESRTGAEIKALVNEEKGILFRLDHDERHRVGNDDVVHLHEHERFIIEERVVITINVDDTDFPVHHQTRTGAEIKHLGHRPPGNTLYRLDGMQRIKIADDETVHLHDLERFVTMPPVGHAA